MSSKNNSFKFLVIGVTLLAVALGLILFTNDAHDPSRAFAGWILGAAFWISILVGMLFLTMLWWLFDAGWAVIPRRQFEHALSAIYPMTFVFLPLLLYVALMGGSEKIPWVWMNLDALAPSGHSTVGADVLYAKKGGYLNMPFFIVRFVMIFGAWSLLAYCFRTWSFKMDETGDPKYVNRSRKLAAAGLFICAIVTTMASIDWFKSMNYHWFSTMYGVWFFAASMRAALSTLIILLLWQGTREDGLKGIVKPAHTHLVGCLMLAFTVFWAYISFCQFFLIYNANIPEETFWYNIRELGSDGSKNSWYVVSRGLIYLYFFAPFLYLLWYKNKFGARILFAAVWILFFHYVDLIWNILPQKMGEDHGSVLGYSVRQYHFNIVDLLVFVGAGSLCLWAYLRSVATYRSVPIQDPRVNESIHIHE